MATLTLVLSSSGGRVLRTSTRLVAWGFGESLGGWGARSCVDRGNIKLLLCCCVCMFVSPLPPWLICCWLFVYVVLFWFLYWLLPCYVTGLRSMCLEFWCVNPVRFLSLTFLLSERIRSLCGFFLPSCLHFLTLLCFLRPCTVRVPLEMLSFADRLPFCLFSDHDFVYSRFQNCALECF